MPDQIQSSDSDTQIPSRLGFGLASVISGAIAILLTGLVGVCGFVVSTPVFLVWFLMPIIIITVILGMIAANNPKGVAGATLGLIAFILAMTFVFVDRMYGPDIRAQLTAQSSKPPALNLDALFQAGTKAIGPTTRP